MSTITGWLHLLRSPQLTPEQHERGLRAIERATRSQNQLIADLLDVSRIIAGKLSLDLEPVELRALLENSIESVAFDAAAKNIEITVDVLGAECFVLGDRGRLQQVFVNLCSTAVKFTQDGGKLEVRAVSDRDSVTVSVADTGQGISAEFLPHVFDRFRQADGSTVRRHGGMGLGLAIVRHLVELHGGRVSARSEGEGKGATFTVQLPRARTDAGLAAAGVLVPLAEVPLRGTRVLLIEDDPDGREVLTTLLVQQGAECRVAAGALEGLWLLDSWSPDVIVSDIAMSDVDGYGFVQRLRMRYSGRGG
jgi:signal transduction histidine kinase